MKKRVIFTIVLAVIGASSFFFGVKAFSLVNSGKNREDVQDSQNVKPRGAVAAFLIPDIERERGIQKKLTEKSKQVLGVWATLKVINGVINVLQSAQIGGSFFVEASVNPLEFLAPIDNVLDRISNMLLWALGAILFEKILLAISGYVVFLIIIPVCALITIATIWTSKDKTKLRKTVIVSALVSLIVSFAIPISFQLSAIMETKILTNNVGYVLSLINEKGDAAETMEREVTGLRRVGSSIINYMSNAKNLGNALIEDIINYFILFIFTSIVIPILTILGLYWITKYLAKIILGN
jgi:hypothetical protein